MRWTYSIQNKFTASSVLLLLCLLVLYSNYTDRKHTENVKKEISTLYEDRLIAEGYILEMTSGIYKLKEVIYTAAKDSAKIEWYHSTISNIQKVNTAYRKTKFTELENRKADDLEIILDKLESIDSANYVAELESANQALDILNELSAIQLEESKQIMKRAESLYKSSKVSSQFAFALVIIILIVLQAIVFTSKTLPPDTAIKFPNMN